MAGRVRIDGLEERLRALDDHVNTRKTLADEADAVARDLCALDAFVRSAAAALDAATAYYDRVLNSKDASAFRERLSETGWPGIDCHALIPLLSACYHALRTTPGATGQIWVPPSTFVRATRKYLVRSEDVLRLECALLKHLPLSIPGEDAFAALNASHEGLATQRISSTYLDAPGALPQYHERLRRDEGARLVRLRWYGPQFAYLRKSIRSHEIP